YFVAGFGRSRASPSPRGRGISDLAPHLSFSTIRPRRKTNMKHFVCALFALAIVFSLSAGSVSAHHSFAATYLEGQTQKIEGKVVQFLFRNPHSFMHVEAPDEKGTMHVGNVVWGGGGLLGGQGAHRAMRQSGDRGF